MFQKTRKCASNIKKKNSGGMLTRWVYAPDRCMTSRLGVVTFASNISYGNLKGNVGELLKIQKILRSIP